MIIAIDGPASSGKSTIAKVLARHLKVQYVDSGALYRTLALYGILHHGSNEGNQNKISTFFQRYGAEHLRVDFTEASYQVWLHSLDVSQRIRTAEVTAEVKHVANHPGCRDFVNSLMRTQAEKGPVVIDGRDIGTVVFPSTPNKFYLDASAEVRGMRRAKEMSIPEGSKEFESLVAAIAKRDAEDMAREIAPLTRAEDAKYLDCSDMSIDEVVTWVAKHLVDDEGQLAYPDFSVG